ncbi:MAG TPA: hypothetical protein VJ853_09685, partial [Thermoanaerobaculia bacterium]|nr:hypothetical protein [Thermoanaerobaculia bacterium]
VVARPGGWVVVNATSVTPLAAGDPPVAGTSIPLSGIDRGPFASSGNPVGLVYARGAQVFFRSVGIVAARRRVVAP